MNSIIRYTQPARLIVYSLSEVFADLVEARAAVEALRQLPLRKAWVDELQRLELKREIAGTTRIEGAQFTERELESALKETPTEALNRSQREARAAGEAYRWIARVPLDQPITPEVVLRIHRAVVAGANEECEPGALRREGHDVSFGSPRRGGALGGQEVQRAFETLCQAMSTEFREHDPLIQALAAHYHITAIHPFSDGNGRTARALEALLLRRAGLREVCFIAMSNHYYEEKPAYMEALRSAGEAGHDLTPFLRFGLQGIATQTRRVLAEVKAHVARSVYRELMFELFGRLKGTRTRVIAKRQLGLLSVLLEAESVRPAELFERTSPLYARMKSGRKAFSRDLAGLLELRAVEAEQVEPGKWMLKARLELVSEIDGSTFMEKVLTMPKAKSYPFLRGE